jgi:hypothetical protein
MGDWHQIRSLAPQDTCSLVKKLVANDGHLHLSPTRHKTLVLNAPAVQCAI